MQELMETIHECGNTTARTVWLGIEQQLLPQEFGSSESAEGYDLATSKRSSDDKGDIDRKQKRHVGLHRK
jgi:hypothetical protein